MDTLGPWLPDARLLDLFAGAGGVGLEALSRGAAHTTFVERDPRAIAALVENIRTLDLEPRTHVVRGDVTRQLERLAGEADEWGALAALYEARLGTSTDAEERIWLLRRMLDHSASAPEMISINSLVIAAWRVRL